MLPTYWRICTTGISKDLLKKPKESQANLNGDNLSSIIHINRLLFESLSVLKLSAKHTFSATVFSREIYDNTLTP